MPPTVMMRAIGTLQKHNRLSEARLKYGERASAYLVYSASANVNQTTLPSNDAHKYLKARVGAGCISRTEIQPSN